MTTTDSGLPEELEARVYEIFFDGGESKDVAFAELVTEHPRERTELESVWRRLSGAADALGAEPIEVRDPAELGPYRIVRRLGTGGFGVVYLAEQEEPIRRSVAIKQLLGGLESERIVRRFHTERQALARMSHPCIAMAIDAGTSADGRPYLVMEYVDGQPIDDYCDAAELSVRDRLELFLEVLDGVQHAHHKAILHRDLKPTNILVTEVEGRVLPKIIDFGISRLFEDGGDDVPMHTLEGHFVGTPEFVSPEQAAGRSSALDTRCDVYALGVVLYRILTGTLPFARGELMESGFAGIADVLRRRSFTTLSQRVRSLGQEHQAQVAEQRSTTAGDLHRRLRGDLDGIVRKATEFEPDRRYASAAEFAFDIRNHLADLPIRARPPSRVDELVRFVRRHTVAVAATGIVFLTLAVGLIVSSILYADAVAARGLAELREYESGIALADHALRENNAASTRARLDACDPRFRGFEWFHLQQRLGKSTQVHPFGRGAYYIPGWFTPGGDVFTLGWRETSIQCAATRPDGSERWRREFAGRRGGAACSRLFAFTTGAGRTSVFSTSDGQKVGEVSHPPGTQVLAIAADGDEMLFLGAGISLTLIERESSRVICEVKPKTNRYPAGIARDARHVLVHPESPIRQAFYPRGALLYELGPDGAREHRLNLPAFVASGEMVDDGVIAVGTARGVSIVDVESGDVLREFAANGGSRVGALLSLGDGKLMTGGADTAVEIWDWRRGVRESLFLGARRPLSWLDVSSDGREILAMTAYEGCARIERSHRAGRISIQVSDWGIAGLSWSRDGESLYVGDEDGGVHKFDWRRGERVARHDVGERIGSVALHPVEDKLFVVHEGAERVTVFDGELRVEERFLETRRTLWGISVSPAGDAAVVPADAGGLLSIDLETHEVVTLRVEDGEQCLAAEFTPDGAEIWAAWWNRDAGVGMLECRDAHSGEVRLQFECATKLSEFEFPVDAPDRFFATGLDGELEMRSRADGALMFSRRAHTAHVKDLAVWPDGSRVATAAMDGTAKIWFVPTATDVVDLQLGNDWLYCARFHPSGKALAIGGERGEVSIWLAEDL